MKKKYKFKLWHVALAALFLAVLFLPLPVYIESPGAAKDVANFVRVEHKKDTRPGSFMLVYVKEAKATPLTWLVSFTDKHAVRVPAKEEVGNYNDREMERIQQYYMNASVAEAKYRALKLTNLPVKRHYIGLYVMSVLKNSHFSHKLQIGDVVTKINGKHYGNSGMYINVLKKMSPNQLVKIEFLRDKAKRSAVGRLIKLPGINRNGLGITLTDRVKTTSNVNIATDMQGIGGPSAGLMLTLQMYSQLSHVNLLQHRKIAGTGTMETNGSIGQIGGVQQKVVAADRAGAQIFFAPDDPKIGRDNNYTQAVKTGKELHSNLKVIPARNISQVLSYLKNN